MADHLLYTRVDVPNGTDVSHPSVSRAAAGGNVQKGRARVIRSRGRVKRPGWPIIALPTMCDAAPKPPDDRRDAAPKKRSDADRALANRLLSDAKAGRDVRTGKVRRVRAAIDARSYENELKLAVALDRLQDLVWEEGEEAPLGGRATGGDDAATR
jgi:hypothetical protein